MTNIFKVLLNKFKTKPTKKTNETIKKTQIGFIGKTKTVEIIDNQDVIDLVTASYGQITNETDDKLNKLKAYSDNQDQQINQELATAKGELTQNIQDSKQELNQNIADLKNYCDTEDNKLKQDINQLAEDKKGLIAGSTQTFIAKPGTGLFGNNIGNGRVLFENNILSNIYFSQFRLSNHNKEFSFNSVYQKLTTKKERDNNTRISIRPVNAYIKKWNINSQFDETALRTVKVWFGNNRYMGEVINVDSTTTLEIKVDATAITFGGFGLPDGSSSREIEYEILVQFERVS